MVQLTTREDANAPTAAREIRGLIVDLLRAGRAVHFRAQGDSMHPVIRSGDRLHVQPAGEASVGEIVLTIADRGLTVHRLVEYAQGHIVTRGDNLEVADAPLPPSHLLGRVTGIERGSRRLMFRRASRSTMAIRRMLRRGRMLAASLRQRR